MKYTKYIVQSIIGLFLSFGIMCYRGLFQTETAADREIGQEGGRSWAASSFQGDGK